METIPARQHDVSTSALLVLQAYSDRGVARTADGELLAFRFRRPLERPLPGDRIRLDQAGTLVEVCPRRNCFGRGDTRGRLRPIAANLDQTIIVIAPEPAPSPDLLHRYLAAAHLQQIEPVIVLNKTDLELPEQPPFTELDALAELGYRCISVRCQPEPETGDLPDVLADQISLFAGQSGVGKSSLLNALIPDLDIQTHRLSRVTGKGTHTTTSASLHCLPGGGWAVDTPGVWEYGLWRMQPRELQKGFPEFAVHAGQCRFRDCIHREEPGCAILNAVENGEVPAFRHQAWLRLLTEQARLARG